MNKPVQITLSEPFDRIIEAEIESGRFGSAQEVVEAGLRLLEEKRAKYEPLRQVLMEGAQSGEPRPFDPEASMTSVRNSWSKRS